jgi:hypothetical protein
LATQFFACFAIDGKSSSTFPHGMRGELAIDGRIVDLAKRDVADREQTNK